MHRFRTGADFAFRDHQCSPTCRCLSTHGHRHTGGCHARMFGDNVLDVGPTFNDSLSTYADPDWDV